MGTTGLITGSGKTSTSTVWYYFAFTAAIKYRDIIGNSNGIIRCIGQFFLNGVGNGLRYRRKPLPVAPLSVAVQL